MGEIGSPAHKGGVYAVSISFLLEVLKSRALADLILTCLSSGCLES